MQTFQRSTTRLAPGSKLRPSMVTRSGVMPVTPRPSGRRSGLRPCLGALPGASPDGSLCSGPRIPGTPPYGRQQTKIDWLTPTYGTAHIPQFRVYSANSTAKLLNGDKPTISSRRSRHHYRLPSHTSCRGRDRKQRQTMGRPDYGRNRPLKDPRCCDATRAFSGASAHSVCLERRQSMPQTSILGTALSTTVEFLERPHAGVVASDMLSLRPDESDARATIRRGGRARRRRRAGGG
jgi:hypothetical protein